MIKYKYILNLANAIASIAFVYSLVSYGSGNIDFIRKQILLIASVCLILINIMCFFGKVPIYSTKEWARQTEYTWVDTLGIIMSSIIVGLFAFVFWHG
ncbi:hypothetical protein [Acetivibrio cellulolyticus]|uniref:hypothetical protein n=1 Tax=Acetivibrio cellulolyticus TaxID=35830 RepID=UPI0001E2CBD8|nr:hypothetical protein [Acetivibrio cellulolyticus]